MTQLLLAYYGDDFTGSTDALEWITRAGARAVLFLDVPTAEQLARYPDLQAFGVAGHTRSLAPDAMADVLKPAFVTLRDLGAPHVHYKVCSTFDSSPEIGSIGQVIDAAWDVFKPPFIPVLAGAPALGRYCVFGNLFAREGIGTENPPVRLDRLPAMQNHPVTPMRESDLRVHLARQTAKQIGLFGVLDLELPSHERLATVRRLVGDGAPVVLFDVLYAEQLARIGDVLDHFADSNHPLFSVGSSAVEMALGTHWQRVGRLEQRDKWEEPRDAGPILVVSGSCSPVTAGQIDWAVEHGFAEVALAAAAVASADGVGHPIEQAAAAAVEAMRLGRSVVVHTSRGGHDSGPIAAQVLGQALADVVRSVSERCNLVRLCIAGGDTSSFVARHLGIEALEMIAPLAPGAPLCRVYAPGSPVDGVEINVKGGQVGRPDFFASVAAGKLV